MNGKSSTALPLEFAASCSSSTAGNGAVGERPVASLTVRPHPAGRGVTTKGSQIR